MGTWGVGILADDQGADVYADYMRQFNDGASHPEILQKILHDHPEVLEDSDDGPVSWFAIARAQWECGALSAVVLSKVKTLVPLDLQRWQGNAKTYCKRKMALETFISKLESINSKPRKPKGPPKIQEPIFQPGDCLAIKLEDGTWGAALVLRRNATPSEYGINAIATLAYKGHAKPSLDVFTRRQWLKLTFGKWNGKVCASNYMRRFFKHVRDSIECIGNIELRETDPSVPESYSRWELIAQKIILQDKHSPIR